MTVLITGAAGRVGSTVTQRLVREGWKVKAMVRKGGKKLHHSLVNYVDLVEADLRDQSSLDFACEDVTHVIHLAAQLTRGDTPVDRFVDINSLGTLRLLEAASRRATIERFVLVSSDGVYRPGDPPSTSLTENVSLVPADYYGTSKLLGEIILQNHSVQYDIPFSIIRLATVVSPEESYRMFRSNFWRSFLKWKDLGKDSHLWPLFDGQDDLLSAFAHATEGVPDDAAVGFIGPNSTPWILSMVDVRDAAEGIYRALTGSGATGRVFNIAAAKATSHDEATAAISETFDVPRIMVRMPMVHHLELDIDAARTFLNYNPRYDFRDTVSTGYTDGNSDYVSVSPSSGVGNLINY